MDNAVNLQVVFDYCIGVARGTVCVDRFKPVIDSQLATTISLFHVSDNPFRRPLHTTELFGEFEAKEFDFKLVDLD